MDKRIKAAFFDIDGTLYSHAIHDVPYSTKKALFYLHECGIKVGIATSRCRYEMRNTSRFLQTFPFDGSIYDGGALVLDKESMISAQTMEKEDVYVLLSYAKRHGLTFRYSTYDGDYFASAPNFEDRDIFFELYLNTPTIKEYQNDEVLNILIYARNDKQKAEIVKLLPHISMINHDRVLEINSGKVDKSLGVGLLSKTWGIHMDEIICFGDGANDVYFLKAAGIGVAMGNGCSEVKAVADFVSKKIDEDGISHALQTYGII